MVVKRCSNRNPLFDFSEQPSSTDKHATSGLTFCSCSRQRLLAQLSAPRACFTYFTSVCINANKLSLSRRTVKLVCIALSTRNIVPLYVLWLLLNIHVTSTVYIHTLL